MDLDKLLIRSVERGASDLHLKPNSPPVLRIHGRLVPQPDLGVVSIGEMEDMARHILSERTYGQLKDGREVDVAYAVRDHGRFRVNLFLATGYIRAVMRAIPSKKPKFEELGLPQVLEKLAMERRGMVLVTGITGSGKSTTLAAMIDFINRNQNDHIITIEDPIEFSHEDINCVVSQREIGHDSSNFARALRAALREDPDVIMIGTALIRDCIREAKRTPEIRAIITQGTTQYGMQTFDQCLLKLYRDSVVSYETAREAATNPDDFDLKVRGIFSTGELTFEGEKKKQEEAAAKPPTSSPFFRRP